MSARRRSRIWAVALVATLALPGAASAAPRFYTARGGFFTTGVARGSNGFKLQLWEGNQRGVKLTASKHGSKTFYATHGGPVADGRVSARLGGRGGFDLRFVPTGKPKVIETPSYCTGPPSQLQFGYLVGHFAFHGERDFTDARRQRMPAARDTWKPVRCRYATGRDYHGDKVARARVGSWSSRHKALSFGAALFHRDARPAGKRVEFRASLDDQSGRVRVERQVEVAAPEADVDFPDGPLSETATVSPPAPFSGTATFARTHESTFTWTGDLAVIFPGTGPVRLAGPRFGARLCTVEGCIFRDQEGGFGEGR
jgi:hypothetical protein